MVGGRRIAGELIWRSKASLEKIVAKKTTIFHSVTSKVMCMDINPCPIGGILMAAGTFKLSNPRKLLYDAILEEIRSWADIPRRIFMQVHYSGKSVEEIASQSGCDVHEVLEILEAHELKLRKSLRALRIQ
jgi:hypothetical protein